GWDSPWGRGRPGWHLECSAMSKENLGVTFDIHGGGLDLIFPHHENEIAQSRCANDSAPLAKYWVHNGFLIVNGEKMSKSLGNFFTIRDLVTEDWHSGEALRLALLSAHYRQPLDFTKELLTRCKATLDRWYGALRPLASLHAEKAPAPPAFEAALLDDLNTPLAIAHIHELVGELNRAGTPADQTLLKAQLLACGGALGLLQKNPEAWFKGQPAEQGGFADAKIEAQIAARLAARKAKNFAEADRIRDELAAQGILLEDSTAGTTWRRG
ncbi:MAG: class I tRNA ligase family protein, partial [Alphaproteobacteria bacterium]|nr:class I tRNA ligase family protein [Alphaproteobacteria bacterium]